MKRYSLDTDDATIVDIRAPQARSFDLTIDTGRNLTGEAFRLDVRDHGDNLILSFDATSGLTVLGQSVRLIKSGSQMLVPTGCWHYDLVERNGTDLTNVLKGSFIILPSVTLWAP